MKTSEFAADNNVTRKTSEEIKKGLRTAKHVQCMEISDDDENCGTHYGVLIGYVLRDKIFAYIQQLESTVSQVSKALCGKGNASMDELLKAADQLKYRVKKPVEHGATLYRAGTCPSCGNVVSEHEKWGESIVRIETEYCKFCGQHLDWNGFSETLPV